MPSRKCESYHENEEHATTSLNYGLHHRCLPKHFEKFSDQPLFRTSWNSYLHNLLNLKKKKKIRKSSSFFMVFVKSLLVTWKGRLKKKHNTNFHPVCVTVNELCERSLTFSSAKTPPDNVDSFWNSSSDITTRMDDHAQAQVNIRAHC